MHMHEEMLHARPKETAPALGLWLGRFLDSQLWKLRTDVSGLFHLRCKK